MEVINCLCFLLSVKPLESLLVTANFKITPSKQNALDGSELSWAKQHSHRLPSLTTSSILASLIQSVDIKQSRNSVQSSERAEIKLQKQDCRSSNLDSLVARRTRTANYKGGWRETVVTYDPASGPCSKTSLPPPTSKPDLTGPRWRTSEALGLSSSSPWPLSAILPGQRIIQIPEQ